GAPVRAAIEEVGRFEKRDLSVGELAQDRLLARQSLLVRCTCETEELGEVALASAPAASLEGRRRGRALLDPARLGRKFLAERTHVNELRALGRSKAHGALAHQQRPLAHGARPRRCDFCDPHGPPSVARVAQHPANQLLSLTCVFYM